MKLETIMTTDINTLSKPQLLDILNAHSGKAPVKAWKSKTSELVARVLKVAPQLFDTFTPATNDELVQQAGRPVNVDETTVVEAAKPAKAKRTKAPTKSEVARGAIRDYAEELLLKSKGTDEKTKRPLGLTYAEVLAKVQAKFPSASTSVNCLRWYATKMNKRTGKDKVVMPVRPKAVAA